MGLKKGQASKAYEEGKMEKYNFKNLSKEEMSELARKGAKKRWENERKRKEMREQMGLLLSLDTKSKKGKELLKERFGIEPDEADNQMLLMATVLTKALTGDMQAVKQIIDIMGENNKDKQEEPTQAPVINIIGVSSKVKTKGNVKINEESEEFEQEQDWE